MAFYLTFGILVGFIDALQRADEFRAWVTLILILGGIVVSEVWGHFNSEKAVSLIVSWVIDYMLGLVIGEAIGTFVSSVKR